MKLKPIIIVNINCSQSILNKNYYYNPKNSLLFVYQHFQKSHNEMSHPVYIGNKNIHTYSDNTKFGHVGKKE